MDETAPATGEALARTLPVGEGGPDTPMRSGTRIGRYVVLERLGHGGMGEVYACHDPALDRRVAVKLLHPSAQGSNATDALVQRLRKEAQAAARLSHRNVVTVFDVGVAELDERGKVFVAMELIEGGTLEDWSKKPRRWDEAVAMYVEAGRGLAAVHSAGIVHRDFKPQNVLVTRDGEPKVSDFGLATSAGDDGEIAGTPAFMPPEQRRGARVDARADVYAFCVALFRAVYGVYPFGDSTDEAARRSEANAIAEVPRRGPPALAKLLRAGLDADPAKRPATLEALLGELAKLIARRPRWLIPAIAALVIGGGVLAIWLATRPAPAEACGGARREIEAVWGPAQRAAIAEGFAKSGRDYAAASAERAGAHLDRWAARWATEHTDVCRATRVDRSQSERAMDLRIACLERQRTDLGTLVELLGRGDADVIARAGQLALALPAPDACDDVGALEAAGDEDPELGQRIGEVNLRMAAGRYDDAVTLGTTALADARARDLRATAAQAGVALGTAQLFAGDYEAAKDTLFHAALDAQVTRQPSMAVQAWAASLSVLTGTNAAPADEAQSYAQGQAALEAAEHPLPLEEAVLLHNHAGFLLNEANRPEDAIPLLRRALTILRERVDPDHPLVASVLDTLGSTLVETGDFDGGIAMQRDALAMRERLYGAEHPVVSRSLQNLAISLAAHDQLADAEPLFERALDLKLRTLGDHHPSVSNTYMELAELFAVQRRFDEAVEMSRRDFALWQAQAGVGSEDAAKSQRDLGDMLEVAGHHAEALVEYEAALASFETLVLAPSMARTRQAMVRPLLALGRVADAEAANAAADAALGTDTVSGQVAWARIALARRDAAKARRALDAAEAIAQAHPDDVKDSTRADLRLLEAEVLAGAGDAAGARARGEEVRALCNANSCGKWTADRLDRAGAYTD